MARVPHPIKKHPAMTYKEPLLVRAGRYSMTGLLILTVLIVLYVIAWFVTSMSLRSGVQDWFEARKAEGYLASFDEKKARISGFPFSVKATLSGVTFAPPKDDQGKRPWIWSHRTVDFSVVPLPWSLRTLKINLAKQQSFRSGKVSFNGTAKEFNIELDWMSDGLPDHLDVKVKDLNLEPQTTGRGFVIKDFSLGGERLSSGNYDYNLQGSNITLPVSIAGLGRKLDEVVLRGYFDQNFAQSGLTTNDLETWRDAGGTLEAKRVQLSYGTLSLQGNGTIALDGELQPVGAFTARIKGFFETVERMRRVGIIRGPNASMAKVVLGGLAKPATSGGPSTISLPLTLQDKALFAGQVRLVEMPTIEW
ncbi:DUF2125 domain-containing protein [Terasakiella sp. A23]|uniref:DUF2125 domain-containing protein n=1 Tax=Terasakiella sp. FCG-A23 TaxID=3080561 RepID=UPI002953A732|nr:DUF2125 domain-containing protein [Terasakiella sp. A23]MDV7338395.1 DUF2125 domain-containing protein [Terasakiella sp. A23]